MDNNKLSNYIYASDEVGSGIGYDHISVFEAGVCEGLRRAHAVGNLDSKLLSRLESILADIPFVAEEIEHIIEELEEGRGKNAGEAERGQGVITGEVAV